VRRQHLDRLRPVCPTCRARTGQLSPLALGTVVSVKGDDVREGVLVCSEATCLREHPIVDGIPIVVSDLQSWATHQLNAVFRRDDLSGFLESLLGDAAGPASELDRERTTLSAYSRVHWADFDPGEPLPRESSFANLVDSAFDLLSAPPTGVWIDLGCAVGRGTRELGCRTGALSIGVDLSFSMLRVAERARHTGRVVYPQKRVGMVFDRRDFPVADMPAELLSYWCCDVGNLPFVDATFDGALSLNVLDCVASPLQHLLELGRVLRADAPALLSTPYDWSANATPLADWVGGHSQRGDAHGSSAAELRRVLRTVDMRLSVVAERDPVPWRVYVNERASMDYALHMLLLKKSG
jgi:SAM-dependent methyltransferase/uncharacterized protein YbaR (Trm112 family)